MKFHVTKSFYDEKTNNTFYPNDTIELSSQRAITLRGTGHIGSEVVENQMKSNSVPTGANDVKLLKQIKDLKTANTKELNALKKEHASTITKMESSRAALVNALGAAKTISDFVAIVNSLNDSTNSSEIIAG